MNPSELIMRTTSSISNPNFVLQQLYETAAGQSTFRPDLTGFGIYNLQELKRIYRVYHTDKRHNIFHFIALEMSYQMPFNIVREADLSFESIPDPVLAE